MGATGIEPATVFATASREQILGLCEAGLFVAHGREQVACFGQLLAGSWPAESDQAPTLAEESVAEPGKATELAPARAACS